MSNLLDHAEREFKYAGWLKDNDNLQNLVMENIRELLTVFSNQGHSEFSASYVLDVFNELARFKPLSGINCTDDEWVEVSENVYQNIRLCSVFKEGKNGLPYYLDAITWYEPSGSCFHGMVEDISSRQYINLPFHPKTFYIKVSSDRTILDKDELKNALAYYKQINK